MPKKNKFTQKVAQNGSTLKTSNDATSEEKSSEQVKAEERGEWTNKWEYALSCMGYSVGLGKIWRFPYLAYENGGAAFLIAYIILQFLIGIPMYFVELALGQYSGKGPTTIWALNPSGKGIGISQAIVSLVVAIYYNVILAYTLYYMFASMQGTLPWTVCKEDWKQFGCVENTTRRMQYCDDAQNITEYCLCPLNATFDVSLPYNCTNISYVGNPTPVAELYFYKEVIQRAPNIYPKDIAAPLWKLALCLLLSWIIIVVCLIKGIKSSGKVAYFTATFPYVILLILLVRGATLNGAIDGVLYFIVPKWEKLLDLKRRHNNCSDGYNNKHNCWFCCIYNVWWNGQGTWREHTECRKGRIWYGFCCLPRSPDKLTTSTALVYSVLFHAFYSWTQQRVRPIRDSNHVHSGRVSKTKEVQELHVCRLWCGMFLPCSALCYTSRRLHRDTSG